nr:unnamed protein product [Ananas comosus var. bracteatus]
MSTAPDGDAAKSSHKSKRGRNDPTKVQASASPSKKPSKKKSRKVGGEHFNNKQVTVARLGAKHHEWKGQDLGLNQVVFDESTMPVPVCSCTGKYQPCYKWGDGGWQSACCTTTLSMYPLPVMPNKRHARVGGRKMSGSVFKKLISRLAAEGYDLSMPIDLKDHWAKHGTNRYITIK